MSTYFYCVTNIWYQQYTSVSLYFLESKHNKGNIATQICKRLTSFAFFLSEQRLLRTNPRGYFFPCESGFASTELIIILQVKAKQLLIQSFLTLLLSYKQRCNASALLGVNRCIRVGKFFPWIISSRMTPARLYRSRLDAAVQSSVALPGVNRCLK